MRVAFDSRPSVDAHGVGHYSRCFCRRCADIAGERHEILETHRPRRAEVFHAPWIEGAMLHSPCPMIVTIHDLPALTRRSERLRSGGVHLRLRHLALQRATHVIVPTDVIAGEAVTELGLERERVVVIPQAPHPAAGGNPAADIRTGTGTGPVSQAAPAAPAVPAWTWEDAGRETWRVYEEAIARPERVCISRFGRRRATRVQ